MVGARNGRVGSGDRDKDADASDADARFVHREVIGLIVLSAVVAAGFLFTRAAAAANRTLRSRDATVWYDLGTRERAAGRTRQAVQALRRATTLDRDRRQYRLALGSALAANGDDDGARQVLLQIRDTTPDSPDVNIQLAQLEARGGHVDAAVRYYGSALQGMWHDDQRDMRRRVRVELVRFLLSRDLRSRALSELLILTSSLPDESQPQNEAARLLIEAGDPARALVLFRRVLEHDPMNAAAIEGAGVAAFNAGDYGSALRYLQGALEPLSQPAAAARTISGLVVSRDPLRAGLGLEERRRRLVADIASAREHLAACVIPANDSETRQRVERLRDSASNLDATVRPENLQHFPDAVEAAYREIYRIEQESCGLRTPTDQALLIIGRRHEADQ